MPKPWTTMQVKEMHAQHARDWLLMSVSRVAHTRSKISRSRVVGEMCETEVTALFRHGDLEPSRDRMRPKTRDPKSVVLSSD